MTLLGGGRLALLLLATAFFPRLLTAAGAPKILDFAHFGLAAVLTVLLVPRMRSADARLMSLGLLALLAVVCASALLNGAGVANAGLGFLLLTEPFLLLLLLLDTSLEPRDLRILRVGVSAMAVVHIGLALSQYAMLGEFSDDVKGVFLDQGAGHHVGGAVALMFGIYALATPSLGPRILRLLWALAGMAVVVVSDSKQVLAVFLASVWILAIARLRDPGRGVLYVLGGAAAVGVLVWAAAGIWPALGVWADATRIETGMTQKLSVFPLMESSYRSSANWALGLGPGHTVGRLGHMLPAYLDVLEPLGATVSPVTEQALIQNEAHWVSHPVTGSSLWALTFFWAGLWGDLGAAGVLAYGLLWAIVWRELAPDDLSRFLVLNILVFGAVFAWPEEPGYMLFAVFLIGLRRHEVRAAERGSAARPDPRSAEVRCAS